MLCSDCALEWKIMQHFRKLQIAQELLFKRYSAREAGDGKSALHGVWEEEEGQHFREGTGCVI